MNLRGFTLTPLAEAGDSGDLETARLLIAKGANVNALSPIGTPAARAAYYTRVPMLDLLLKHNADLNLTDAEGRAALDWALKSRAKAERKEETIAWLTARGAREMQPAFEAAAAARQAGSGAAPGYSDAANRLADAARKAALALGYSVQREGQSSGHGRYAYYRGNGVALQTEVQEWGNGDLRITAIVSASSGADRALEARKYKAVLFKLLEIQSANGAWFRTDGNVFEYR